jgi:hypothetical protein
LEIPTVAGRIATGGGCEGLADFGIARAVLEKDGAVFRETVAYLFNPSSSVT